MRGSEREREWPTAAIVVTEAQSDFEGEREVVRECYFQAEEEEEEEETH